MMKETLDMNYAISNQLSEIYTYIIKILSDGIENKEPIFVNDALRVIKPLQRAFEDIQKDGYGDLNKNNLGTNVFAGLTYGKGGLNEFVDDAGGRNFSG